MYMCECCENRKKLLHGTRLNPKCICLNCLYKGGITFKRKYNTYREEKDYMICECEKGYFIFDKEDYEKIKLYYWNFTTRNQVVTHIQRKSVQLSRFLTGITDKSSRILFKNRDFTDYRRENLYSGNTYIEKDDYYIGKCFNDEEFLIDKEDYEWIKEYR